MAGQLEPGGASLARVPAGTGVRGADSRGQDEARRAPDHRVGDRDHRAHRGQPGLWALRGRAAHARGGGQGQGVGGRHWRHDQRDPHRPPGRVGRAWQRAGRVLIPLHGLGRRGGRHRGSIRRGGAAGRHAAVHVWRAGDGGRRHADRHGDDGVRRGQGAGLPRQGPAGAGRLAAGPGRAPNQRPGETLRGRDVGAVWRPQGLCRWPDGVAPGRQPGGHRGGGRREPLPAASRWRSTPGRSAMRRSCGAASAPTWSAYADTRPCAGIHRGAGAGRLRARLVPRPRRDSRWTFPTRLGTSTSRAPRRWGCRPTRSTPWRAGRGSGKGAGRPRGAPLRGRRLGRRLPHPVPLPAGRGDRTRPTQPDQAAERGGFGTRPIRGKPRPLSRPPIPRSPPCPPALRAHRAAGRPRPRRLWESPPTPRARSR